MPDLAPGRARRARAMRSAAGRGCRAPSCAHAPSGSTPWTPSTARRTASAVHGAVDEVEVERDVDLVLRARRSTWPTCSNSGWWSSPMLTRSPRIRVKHAPEVAVEVVHVRMADVVEVELASTTRPAASSSSHPARGLGGLSRSSGSFITIGATSMRNPSTPRSSQKRALSNIAARICRVAPVEVRLLLAGTCGGSTASWPRIPAPTTVPSNMLIQLFGTPPSGCRVAPHVPVALRVVAR